MGEEGVDTMSLNRSERSATQEELHSNLALSGLSLPDIAVDLGMSGSRVEAAFAVAEARPEDVWFVRDYLDRVIRAGGATPRPYSSLTEQMRAAARVWFRLTDVEDVVNGAER